MASIPRDFLRLNALSLASASGANYPDEASKLDGDWSFSRATSATRTESDGTLETLAADQPRFDWRTEGGVLRPALRLEPQRANLLLQSNVFSTGAWAKGSLTLNSSSVSSPIGTASEYAPTGSDAYLFQGFTGQTGACTASVWLRATTGTVAISLYLVRDSDNAVIGSVALTVTTTWQRYTLTATLTAVGHHFSVGGFGTWGTAEVLQVAGAMVEVGAFATSHIGTTTVSVTRAADSLSIPLLQANSQPTPAWNPLIGTIVVDFVVPRGSSDSLIVQLDDGTMSNRLAVSLYLDQINAFSIVGGVMQGGGAQVVAKQSGSRARVVFGYGANDFALSVDGAAPLKRSTGAVPSGLTTLRLAGGPGLNMVADVYDFQILPRRFSDQLQAQLSAQSMLR